MQSFCPFKKLGIGLFSTEEEVKRAYKRKALQCHSDKARQSGRDDITELDQIFQEINTAYEVLMNETFRQKFRYTKNRRRTWVQYAEWKRESVKQWSKEQEERIRQEEEQRARKLEEERKRQKQIEEVEDRLWEEQEEKLWMENLRQEKLRKASCQLCVKEMETDEVENRLENNNIDVNISERHPPEINVHQVKSNFAGDIGESNGNPGVADEINQPKWYVQSRTHEASKKKIKRLSKSLQKSKASTSRDFLAYKSITGSEEKKKQSAAPSHANASQGEPIARKYADIKKLLHEEKRCRELAEKRAYQLEEQLWTMTNILQGLKDKNLRLKRRTFPANSAANNAGVKSNHQKFQLNRFFCENCQISFSSSSSLCRHRLSHRHPSKIRYHVCKICDKKFTRKDAHDKHIKTHA